MQKTRTDSWAAGLTEEQGWTLYYKSLRCQWQEAAAWAVKEFALDRMPARSSFYDWLKQMREKEHEHRMHEAAVAAAEAAALGKNVTKDEALIAALKTLATEAALNTDARTAKSLIASAMAIKDRLQKDEQLDLQSRADARKGEELKLAREKFEAAEKRLNAAKETANDTKLTSEQKLAKMKEIFG